MNRNSIALDFSGVEETALLTLYARAMESKSTDPILKDEKAEHLADTLDQLFAQRTGAMARQLYYRSIDPRLVIHIPLRSKQYDNYTRQFLKEHPEGAIVNIGCGLDTRFFRIDNQKMVFFDLDLPGIILLKKQLLDETPRYRMIGQSVLEMGWMDQVVGSKKPVLFLAEGVLMYLPEESVKALVLEMQRRFPESELICELTNRLWVEGFWGKISAIKMKKRIKMGGDASFKFGVSDARELETWHSGIEFLEKWFYMDSNHPKLGWIRIFRNWSLIRNAQFTARYRLRHP